LQKYAIYGVSKTKCWLAPNPAFDGPVILFENILEVLHRSVPAIYLQTVTWSARRARSVSTSSISR
jgi:hypothetical protein